MTPGGGGGDFDSSRKISVLRTENFAVNTRTICLPSIYIYIYIYIYI